MKKRNWRRLDNTAKLFSLDNINNTSIFRYSVVLHEKISVKILKKAILKSLNDFPCFRVKRDSGLFWDYLDYNSKSIIIKEENEIPCKHIDFKKNNDFLFKVTYYNKKINIDFFHVLTDGVGAISFFKSVVYYYLNIKYGLCHIEKNNINYKDYTLEFYDKKYLEKREYKPTYKFSGFASNRVNNTYHYTLNLNEIKSVCKNNNVSITEYLLSIYMYSLYLSIYNKKSEKEIHVMVPINLRTHYNVETMSNFFTYMSIYSDFVGKKDICFEDVLKQVKKEFNTKYSHDKIKSYLACDVNIGMNISIRLIPLFLKKFAMKFVESLRASSTILSNVGIIDVDKKYKKYIDNIYMLVMPNKIQRIKCSVCSYDSNLNITINSCINDLYFERVFYNMLCDKFNYVKINGNDDKRIGYVSKKG